ncbi:MAG: DUF1080 domain-containing protein [Planctomycetaceae bacterium]
MQQSFRSTALVSRLALAACGMTLLLSAVAALAVEEAPAQQAPSGDQTTAPADPPEAPEPLPLTIKWTKLFDGKSLKGWEATDFGGEGAVIIKDGNLVIEEGQPLSGVTWKGLALPTVDYEVRLEAQRVQGTDFFVALTFPVEDEFCSLVLGGWGGGVTGISSIDSFDASENSTTSYAEFENGKWYKIRLRVTKTKVLVWLDDEQIIDLETTGKRLTTRIEVDANQPFGLATFQTEAAYRNFEIRKLTDAEAAPKTE